MEDTKVSDPLEVVGDDSINKDKAVDYAKYQKLLGEKKKAQEKAEQAEARLIEIENEKLQAQGKLKEYADNLAKELAKEKATNRETHKNYADVTLKRQFLSEATKLGCVDAESAFKLANLQGIEIKDDFTLDNEGLTSYLNELQKSKSYLFKKEVITPKDSVIKAGDSGTGFNLKTAKPAELIAILEAQHKTK